MMSRTEEIEARALKDITSETLNEAAGEDSPDLVMALKDFQGKLPQYNDYQSVLADLFRWKERQAKYIPSVEG